MMALLCGTDFRACDVFFLGVLVTVVFSISFPRCSFLVFTEYYILTRYKTLFLAS